MNPKPRIVDAWLQHPSPKFLRHDMFASLRRWIGVDTIPDEIPPEATLEALDAGEISVGVLSAWWGPEGPLISNEEVAALVRSFPDRFVGLASVDLKRPMEAIRELRRAIKNGLRGLRILPWLWDLPPTDRRYYPLYAECVELGIPFCLQVGHAGPLCASEPGRPIPYVDQVALDFPELVIVGGHIGYPWTNEMISLATKYPNVYIDTSAYKPSRFPVELVNYMKGHGRNKVLFGSNFPMIQPSEILKELDLLGLDESAKGCYLHANADKVFKLT